MRAALDLNTIKVVSWDVDGTLYSTRQLKWRIVARFIAEVAAGRGASAWRDLVTLRRYRARVEAVRSHGGNPGDAPATAERRWYDPAIARAGPRPGVREGLDWFSARRIPQVIVSDHDAAAKLEVLGLAHYFTSRYCGAASGCVKPSPKLFERVMKDFNIEPHELLHIGDRADTDGAGARDAGARCLILGRDFRDFRALAAALAR